MGKLRSHKEPSPDKVKTEPKRGNPSETDVLKRLGTFDIDANTAAAVPDRAQQLKFWKAKSKVGRESKEWLCPCGGKNREKNSVCYVCKLQRTA